MRETSAAAKPSGPVRIHRFALVSGIGWLMDLAILTGLTATGTPVFPANCVSAATAVSFVFFVSQRRTFVHDGSWIFGKFVAYALYNLVAIALASFAVASLARHVFEPIVTAGPDALVRLAGSDELLALASVFAKLAVTPLTLYANYLFMARLIEGRVSFR